MSWSQIRDLSGDGIVIGSHTQSHSHLPALSTEQAAGQLRASREAIAEQIGKRVDAIAYPYGAVTETIERIAADCGYLFGVTTSGELSRLSERPLALGGINIGGPDATRSMLDRLPPAPRKSTAGLASGALKARLRLR